VLPDVPVRQWVLSLPYRLRYLPAWRAAVVASAGSEWSDAPTGAALAGDGNIAGPRRRGHLWAELMRRSFGLDVLACPQCGGRLRLLALIEHAPIVERIALLTSNRPVDDWGKLLGDTAAVTALLDRLLHHAHVLKCGP